MIFDAASGKSGGQDQRSMREGRRAPQMQCGNFLTWMSTLIMKRSVNMERGERYRRRIYGIKKLKGHPGTLQDDGHTNASSHGSPPRSGVARKGAGTSTNSAAQDQARLVARWVAVQACVLWAPERRGWTHAAVARRAVSEKGSRGTMSEAQRQPWRVN